VLPPRRGHEPGRLRGEVGAARPPEPEGASPALDRLATVLRQQVELVGEAVEVGVARLRDRRRQIHPLVDEEVPVVPDALREVLRSGVRTGTRIERVRLDQMLLEARDRGQRLEGRARWIRAVEGTVERRIVPGQGRAGREPLRGQLAGGDASAVDRRVVGRRGGEREDRAGLRAQRHDRTAAGRPLTVVARALDAVLESVLSGDLQPCIDRQAHRLPGRRRRRQQPGTARAAQRVDAHASRPGHATEVHVQSPLDPGQADHVTGLVAVLPEPRVPLGDLAVVAEQLRRERSIGVGADIALGQRQSRERRCPLFEVRPHRARRFRADDDRIEQVASALGIQDQLGDVPHRDTRDMRDPADLGGSL